MEWDWLNTITTNYLKNSFSVYFYDSKFNFEVLQKVILYSPPFAFLSTIRLVNHSMVSSLVPFASSITTRGLKLGSTVSKKDQLSAIFWELTKYKTKTKMLKKYLVSIKKTQNFTTVSYICLCLAKWQVPIEKNSLSNLSTCHLVSSYQSLVAFMSCSLSRKIVVAMYNIAAVIRKQINKLKPSNKKKLS